MKIDLKSVKNKPDKDVVYYLEQLLREAKQGRLLEFTLVGRYESGQILNCSAGIPDNVYSMLGKLTDLALHYRERTITLKDNSVD